MKIKNITIGIQTLEEGLEAFSRAAKDIQRGTAPQKKEEGVYFTSLDAMRQVLTPRRVELLHAIREKKPGSIYALARMAGRDLKNVQDDVTLLARIGLVSLRRSNEARARVVPRVDYDRLQLQIPLI